MVERIAKHHFVASKRLKAKMSMLLDIKSSERKLRALMTERSNIKNNFVTTNEQGIDAEQDGSSSRPHPPPPPRNLVT